MLATVQGWLQAFQAGRVLVFKADLRTIGQAETCCLVGFVEDTQVVTKAPVVIFKFQLAIVGIGVLESGQVADRGFLVQC